MNIGVPRALSVLNPFIREFINIFFDEIQFLKNLPEFSQSVTESVSWVRDMLEIHSLTLTVAITCHKHSLHKEGMNATVCKSITMSPYQFSSFLTVPISSIDLCPHYSFFQPFRNLR